MCIICCSGQLWFLSPTEDDVDITKRLTPGPSNAGYLVNKRFSDRGDTKSKIFHDLGMDSTCKLGNLGIFYESKRYPDICQFFDVRTPV